MKTPSAPAPEPTVPAQWQAHHRALLLLRDTLITERSERETALRTPRERGGDDALDLASGESESAELVAELAAERTELTEVEAALDRLHRGCYGLCEITGVPIEPERLQALPWTRLSGPVAKKLERT